MFVNVILKHSAVSRWSSVCHRAQPCLCGVNEERGTRPPPHWHQVRITSELFSHNARSFVWPCIIVQSDLTEPVGEHFCFYAVQTNHAQAVGSFRCQHACCPPSVVAFRPNSYHSSTSERLYVSKWVNLLSQPFMVFYSNPEPPGGRQAVCLWITTSERRERD